MLKRVVASCIASLLIGYAFLGKGFAYLHVTIGLPLYVGEMVLASGLMLAALRPTIIRIAFRSPVVWCYALFALLGLMRAVPNFEYYGIDTVRDAAIFYYGLFMVLIAGLVTTRSDIERIVGGFARVAPAFLLWVPVACYLSIFMRDILPSVPGTSVPILWVKPGDAAVHVGAVLVFVLALPQVYWLNRHSHVSTILCLVGLSPTLFSRAAALTSILGVASVAVFRMGPRMGRFIVITSACLLVAILMNASVRLPGRERELSVDGVWNGLKSIVSTSHEGPNWSDMEGTKRWRLEWWRTIYEETVAGPYFWTGRGFGENLALAHGIIGFGLVDRPLRSPHNSHMTILARMGVPGAALWILLNAMWLQSLWRVRRRARVQGDELMSGLATWLLCYWVMATVNAACDVYFEGPQSGIWYWSVMGFGLAVSQASQRRHSEASGISARATLASPITERRTYD